MPGCRTCGVDVKAAYDQIDTARRKLELLQEKVTLDQELLKQDKRNFKRRLQAAKAAVKASQAEVDRKQQEIAHAEETAKKTRRDQDWRQIQELREQLKTQELQFKKEKQNLDDRITILQSSQHNRDQEQQSESQENLKKIQEAQATVRRLETQLSRKNLALESYETQIRELSKKTKEGPSSSSSVASAEQECIHCAASKSQVKGLERSIEEKMETLKGVEANLAKEQQEKEAALRKMETKTTALQQMEIEINQLKTEIENLTAKYEAQEESLTTIRNEYTTSEETNKTLQTQIQELTEQNKTLEDEKAVMVNSMKNGTSSSNGEKNGSAMNGNVTAPASENNNNNDISHGGRMVMEHEWQGDILSGVYTGFLNDDDNPTGSGTLRADDGAVYDGEWLNGKRHGSGVYATVEGDLYRGEWNSDQHHGKGTFVWVDGRVYRGDYCKGERHGQGIMCWPIGANYSGEFAHDKRNGFGKYTHADGRLYSGDYKDDRPHGHGVLKAADGSVIYEGKWELGEQMS